MECWSGKGPGADDAGTLVSAPRGKQMEDVVNISRRFSGDPFRGDIRIGIGGSAGTVAGEIACASIRTSSARGRIGPPSQS